MATATARLFAKLLRELLATERFASLADVTDALKTRAARLHIRATADDISDAYRLVGSNLALVSTAPVREITVQSETRPLGAAETRALLALLRLRDTCDQLQTIAHCSRTARVQPHDWRAR